jgi:hypothetical protein
LQIEKSFVYLHCSNDVRPYRWWKILGQSKKKRFGSLKKLSYL